MKDNIQLILKSIGKVSGVVSLCIGIVSSSLWINELVIQPSPKIKLDWSFYVPFSIVQTMIFIVLGLGILKVVCKSNIFVRVFKWSCIALVCGCSWLIVTLV
jgi:hypothetical protein